ncbi:MAG: transglutaminase-like cysteine peptidase, partial [Methylacidiphilales bacterium]|nr:transglutaminase-like cysteine peptidase [Candidatus Methylacidiphilales bacterium]
MTVALAVPLGARAEPQAMPARKPVIPQSSTMPTGDFLPSPIGAVRFCVTFVDECQPMPAETVVLTAERWTELEAVNRKVNGAIAPRADGDDDIWTLGATAGDCDDYAVQKRHDLIASGWPAGAVGLAVGMPQRGTLHLVTVVSTDRGDYVLDNRRRRVVPWYGSGFRWVMRTFRDDVRVWQAVVGPRSVPPGAIG